MTIHLPEDLEAAFIRAEVHSGHFASADDAIAEAVRLLRQQLSQVSRPAALADPVLGAMRDAADELDGIVADTMTQREQQPWRLSGGE